MTHLSQPSVTPLIRDYFLSVSCSNLILEGKKFLFQNLEAPFTNRELFVASCLLRSLQFDFRTIKEGYDDLNNVNEILLDRSIGHGLFPLLNALGHSCDPNVSMFSYENNLVCRSICPIKAGEQVNYEFFPLKCTSNAYLCLELKFL